MPVPYRRATVAGLVGLALVLGFFASIRFVRDPAHAFLAPEGGAEWIRWNDPPSGSAYWSENRSTSFRVTFGLEDVPERAILVVKAFRSWGVFVNQQRLPRDERDPAPWVHAERVDLAGFLQKGRNEIILTVDNANGPPALLAYSEDLGIRSDSSWEVLSGKGPWSPAAPVSPRPPFPISREFPTSGASLLASLPELLLAFALGAVGSLFLAARPASLRAEHLRLLLLAGFALLCANNLFRIAVGVGFDVKNHYEYVAYIAQYGRLPLATDGWQMFQAPLFYLLAAPFFRLLPEWITMGNTLLALRVLPMLCGLALIEVCYRAARVTFPGRGDLQLIATLVGGLLPMNLYISQVIGNEPLAGALTALSVCAAMRFAVADESAPLMRSSLVLGLLLGLALLAKVTPVVLLPIFLALVVWRGSRRPRALRESLAAASALGLGVAAVSGWYYLRNWILLGRPFVGGWATDRGLTWWQEPGYRVAADFFSFGESLTHPVYAAGQGFWDGLYSSFWLDGHLSAVGRLAFAPPWSFDHMLSMALLSVPMTGALAAGIVRTLWQPPGPERNVCRLSVACVAVYLVAMLAIFARVPSYSAVKASYALGLAPCFAVLIAVGFAPLLRGRVGRALVSGYLCSWGLFGYLAYFAHADPRPPEALILVSIDTLRPDHLGCYGYPRPTSPTLDALAAEGVVFEDVTSPAPWTLPAHASMLTGLYPRRHGVKSIDHRLSSEVPTLATLLSERGFTTAAIVSSEYLAARHGLERGFDQFELFPTSAWQQTPSTLVTDRVIAWLQAPRDDPIFIFAHYYDVHSDYRSIEENESRFVRPYEGVADGSTSQLLEVKAGGLSLERADADHLVDLYDAGIWQMDDEIGRLVAFLREHGLLDRALVVVTSDHGEEFLEHGSVLHGQTHFREVSRVPLLVRGRGVPAGARVATPISLVDLVPTLLALLSVDPAPGLDGVDVSGLLGEAEDGLAERPLFAEADSGLERDANHAVRRGRFVLHVHIPSGRHRLYDLASDPGERTDVSAEHPEIVRELRASLAERPGDIDATPADPLSPEEAARLRELGYLE